MSVTSEPAPWIGTRDHGVIRLDADRTRETVVAHDADDPASLAGNDVWGIAEDGHGSVWVASYDAGTVIRIDPRSGDIVKTIQVGGHPSGIAVGDGRVWVTVS